MREFFTDTNKRIAIYDDLFTLGERQKYYLFCINSNFKLGWVDGVKIEKQKYKFLHSNWSPSDLDASGILDKIKNTAVAKELEGFTFSQTVLNLSVSSNSYFVHAHQEQKILLYYPNLEWEDGWHGETVFYDEPCREIIFTSSYTPGRLCVFDGTIPHALRPPSRVGPDYRFTLAMIFNSQKAN